MIDRVGLAGRARCAAIVLIALGLTGCTMGKSAGQSSGQAREGAAATQVQPSEALQNLVPVLPTIPDRTFNITDYGAVGDGKTINTTAFAKAVAACAAAGGGHVVVADGTFLTQPFELASNLDLHIESSGTILMSNDYHDYLQPAHGYHTFCILADKCHDVQVSGSGTIDGQGALWWKNYHRPPDWPGPPEGTPPMRRPFLLTFVRCQRVLIEDLILHNSPSFHMLPSACDEVTVRNVHTDSPARSPNTDGIDPSGRDYLITHCTFDGGDDCVALKAASLVDAGPTPTCENFLVTDCTCLHGHGISIGSQINGGVKHVLVQNCTFNGTQIGIRLKAFRDRGGLVQDVTYRDISMKNVGMAILITSYYPRIPAHPESDPPHTVTALTPRWRDIHLTNITATGVTNAGRFIGVPEMPIQDVLVTNVHISAKNGMQFINARGIRFVDCSITATNGADWSEVSSDVNGLGPAPTTRVALPTSSSTSATPGS